MVAGLEEGAENGVALRRLLQADAFEVLMEDVLRLADHLAGDRGLVIDAFLQHGLVERIKVPREVRDQRVRKLRLKAKYAESEYHRHLENEIHFQAAPPLSRWHTIEDSP